MPPPFARLHPLDSVDLGHYDVDTVREYKIKQCEAVVKGGRLLEKEAPGERARTDLSADTGDASYINLLKTAGLRERTAERWRAAGRLDAR